MPAAAVLLSVPAPLASPAPQGLRRFRPIEQQSGSGRLTIKFNVRTIKSVQIEFDLDKRTATLEARGLDFAHAGEVFAGRHYTAADERPGYTEDRFITVGLLHGRMVVLVWTPRGAVRRIISMRKANDREQARHAYRFA